MLTAVRTYECLGGPCDGLHCDLPAGHTFKYRTPGGLWHLYAIQPTDQGMMLCYLGLA